MTRLRFSAGLIALLIPFAAQGFDPALGSGADSALSVSGATAPTINQFAIVTQAAAGGTNSVNVTKAGDTSGVDGKEAQFNTNDVVLIWQFAAPGPTTTNTTSPPSAIDISVGAPGRWEWAQVSSHSNVNHTVTFFATLANTYAANVTQIIRVPQYTTVTVTSVGLTPGIVQAPPLSLTDGGGVVAFLATGAVTLTDSTSFISADGSNGAGWPGGAIGTGSSYTCTGTDSTGNFAFGLGAAKGSGFGQGASSNGRGNDDNGGGGGDCVQSGGAGGGNGGKGGAGGKGTDNQFHNGINGAAVTFTALDHLIMGGGGGAGNQFAASGSLSNIDATNGGAGAGVVMIRAASLGGLGLITANGANAPDNVGALGNDGQGGGGAGGTISLRVEGTASVCATPANIQVKGGKGHSSATAGVGPGGGGGGGRILVQSNDATCLVAAATSAAGGVSGLDGAAFPNSATNGDNGVIELPFSTGFCTKTADCAGNTVSNKLKCDVAAGVCVQCLPGDSNNGNSDCTFAAGQPACVNEACVACTNASGCTGNAGGAACRVSDGHCVACIDNTTCTNKSCCTGAGCTANTCIACDATGNDGCSGSPGGSVCDSGSHDCVQCVLDTDCGGTPSTPSCRLSDHTCKVCTDPSFTGNSGCADYASTQVCKSDGTCVQCTASNQCPQAHPVCSGNSCGNCTSNTDCAGFPDAPICDTTTTHGCVKCAALTSECQGISANTPICNPDGHCSACGTSSDCESKVATTTPFCVTAVGASQGECLACASDSTRCNVAANRPICQIDGSCAACTTTGQCSTRNPNTPVCSAGSCNGCSGNSDCETHVAGTTPVCNGNGSCSGCAQSDANCTVTGARPACQNDGSCNACRLAGTFSVGDTGNLTQCVAAKPVCSGAGACSATCSGGSGETLCQGRFGASSHCETNGSSTFNGQCVACRSNTPTESSDCKGDVTHPLCNYASDTCVVCNTSVTAQPSGEQACTDNFSTGGPSPRPHCETTTGSCVNCRSTNSSADCSSATAPVCNGTDTCDGCHTNGDCTKFGASAFCNTSSGHCVGCLVDTDCSLSSAPRCTDIGGGDKACGNCIDDTACVHFADGGIPACQISDGIVQSPGSCKACSKGNTSECTGTTPACNFEIGACQLCTTNFDDLGTQVQGCASNANGHACESIANSKTNVFCGCTSDADCGSNTSGRICDTITRLCQDGCARASGRNNCPAGQFCTSDDPSGDITGVCTMTCNFDTDCTGGMPAMPFCISANGDGGVPSGTDAGFIGVSADGGVGRCAGCRDDADCGGTTPVCEPQKKVCVQCTSTSLTQCTAAAMGAICLGDETCGCSQDSDCGDATSGRICDLTGNHKCTPGCRTTGGNGCPTGLICTGAGLLPGSCVEPNDLAMNIKDASVEPEDMAVPNDLAPTSFKLTGGGFGCDVGGSTESTSLGVLLLMLFALAAVRLRRRAR